jgi:hypothetical protein
MDYSELNNVVLIFLRDWDHNFDITNKSNYFCIYHATIKTSEDIVSHKCVWPAVCSCKRSIYRE